MKLRNSCGAGDMQREGAQTQDVSYAFGADANVVRLVAEAHRLRHAYLFNPSTGGDGVRCACVCLTCRKGLEDLNVYSTAEARRRKGP